MDELLYQITHYFSTFLNLIDNGKFFKRPMKWLYFINGIFPFILPVILIIIYISALIHGKLGESYGSNWINFIVIIFALLILVSTLICAFMSFKFWENRRNQLDDVSRDGEKFIVIPIFAHLIQSWTEWFGLYVSSILSLTAINTFICSLLTGCKLYILLSYHLAHEFFDLNVFSFGDVIKVISLSFITLIIVLALNALFGYLIILLGHFLGERIRLQAQIANDVRDIGDIHRAATMSQTMTSRTMSCLDKQTIDNQTT